MSKAILSAHCPEAKTTKLITEHEEPFLFYTIDRPVVTVYTLSVEIGGAKFWLLIYLVNIMFESRNGYNLMPWQIVLHYKLHSITNESNMFILRDECQNNQKQEKQKNIKYIEQIILMFFINYRFCFWTIEFINPKSYVLKTFIESYESLSMNKIKDRFRL